MAVTTMVAKTITHGMKKPLSKRLIFLRSRREDLIVAALKAIFFFMILLIVFVMDADVVQKMSFDDGNIATYYTTLCPQQRCEFIHLSPHYGRHQWNIDKNEIEKHIRRRDANPAKCQGRRIYNRQEYIAES